MNNMMTTSGYIVRLKELIVSGIGNLFSRGGGLAYAEVMQNEFTKETALHLLLDKGKSFQEAELIIATLEEWGMDLQNVAVLEFEVPGTSVWIKAD